MRAGLHFLILILLYLNTNGQTIQDTSSLNEVVVKAYFSEQSLFTAPGSVSVIGSQVMQNQPDFSLLPAINTAPGVRMEERSPGSYRLSIRGSLLRSPFGIRNVKIYLDDFLLTDAGGNTYLNILDASSVGRIEILKGPEGSVFGANSGGVMLIHSKQMNSDSTSISAGLTVGSYGLIHQRLSGDFRDKDLSLSLNQSFQQAKGYRNHSAMNRRSFQFLPQWNYSETASVKMLAMYSDLDYQTPGGLTLTLLKENPRLARKVSEEQKAAVYNKTLMAGISHTKVFSPGLKQVIALTGSLTDFENPFIDKYETRKERSVGLRTYLELTDVGNRWRWQTGLEAQRGKIENRNYKNLSGIPGDTLNFVDLMARQSFLFTHFAWKASERLSIESALSLNFNSNSYTRIYPVALPNEKRNFKKQLMPRLALSYLLSDGLVLRGSLSRGYSPPTLEEVRPSNLEINTDLEPEIGSNYEGGVRLSILNKRLYFDGVLFHYELKKAIVRRVNAQGSEFFVNAGGTIQTGIETQLAGWVIPQKDSGPLRGIRITESYTYSHFKFTDYIIRNTDFSGKRLTGVPPHNMVSSMELYFPSKLKAYVQHNFVSSLPLNDGNTTYAAKYHLLQAKINYTRTLRNILLNFFVGADNILNADYSLGNDLNAFGSNYFNPAASRNYYGGFRLNF